MNWKTFATYLEAGRLRLMWSASRLTAPSYRLTWLAAAARHGLLARLAEQPAPLETLCREMASGEGGAEALEAWLQMGVRLGEIEKGPEGYRLRSFLARKLAQPEHDAVAAMLEEIATLHHALVMETPERLKRGARWSLDDQDGVLIARSSRAIEPSVHEAIDRVLPASGPIHLLEVGAGSGTHVRYACRRNPRLTALGLELQPAVADLANRNLAEWGLADRALVEAGDVRDRVPEPVFDLVTLHNNIYYFPVDARVALLGHLREFLRPGGALLLTTGCRGGSPVMHALDIWSASTEGCGRLPTAQELTEQMRAAGFAPVEAVDLVPGASFFAFWGTRLD